MTDRATELGRQIEVDKVLGDKDQFFTSCIVLGALICAKTDRIGVSSSSRVMRFWDVSDGWAVAVAKADNTDDTATQVEPTQGEDAADFITFNRTSPLLVERFEAYFRPGQLADYLFSSIPDEIGRRFQGHTQGEVVYEGDTSVGGVGPYTLNVYRLSEGIKQVGAQA